MILDLAEAGRRIESLIKERGQSIQGFALSYGVSRQTAHKWIKGQALTHQRILDLGRHFDVEPSWLLLGGGEKRRHDEDSICDDCDLRKDTIRRGAKEAEFVLEYDFRTSRFVPHQENGEEAVAGEGFTLACLLERVPPDYLQIAGRMKEIFEDREFSGVIYLPIRIADDYEWFGFSKLGSCKDLFLLLSARRVDVKDLKVISG